MNIATSGTSSSKSLSNKVGKTNDLKGSRKKKKIKTGKNKPSGSSDQVSLSKESKGSSKNDRSSSLKESLQAAFR